MKKYITIYSKTGPQVPIKMKINEFLNYNNGVNKMKIQFVQNAFNVVDENNCILEQFPLKEWETEYDSLGKIQAIDYIKEKCGLAILDYNEYYEKVRIRK